MHARLPWLLGIGLLLPAPGTWQGPQAAAADPIAVITSPQTGVDGLSLEQLRRLYLGRSTTWPNGREVVLFELVPSRDAFYRSVLRLSTRIVRQRWIAISFRGEPGTAPREVASVEELLRLVRETPGALGFLPAGNLAVTVQVVRIDGTLPSDPNYPIQATP